MSTVQTAIDPVRKTLSVACAPQRAFEVFTNEIGIWWPTHSYSIGGEKIVEVVFEGHVGGRVFERHSDGVEGEWGRVLEWDPPHRFVMSWYPGHDTAEATELEVRFAGEGERTRVELEHRGWEARGTEGAEARANYDSGWDVVAGCYVRLLNG
jgi:uncharacterized protein YndB with AHSA1/START domain